MIYVSEILYRDVDHRRAYKGSTMIAEKYAVEDMYLVFTATGTDSHFVSLQSKNSNHSIQYSKDDGSTWTNLTSAVGGGFSLTDGQKAYVRGILSADPDYNNYTQFSLGGVKVGGNLNALWNYQNLSAALRPYCGYKLFAVCSTLTDVTELKLPATTLANNCYNQMFFDCGSLSAAPILPATTLADSCYEKMFEYCYSLSTIPNLPATTLTEECYNNMFKSCTGLTDLSNITLPATTLATACYAGMFTYCYNLTAAPELPATSLISDCYVMMFDNCSKLSYVKCLATSGLGSSKTGGWLFNVSSTGTFVKAASASWSTGDSGIPSGWTVIDA